MATVGGHRHISDHEHDQLIRDAVRVEQAEDPLRHHPVETSTHTVKKMVEVPYEETVRVPVEKKVARPGVETKVMRGVELVPVRKFKEVHETVMEVKEEEVKGVREVWVRKQVPYTEIVKKPVKVTKTRRVPYTDYHEKMVEVTVDVPCHKIETHTGYRDDKILKTKLVEVEQDVTVEHRPIIRDHGRMRVRETGESRDHGVVRHGQSYMTGRTEGREYYGSEYGGSVYDGSVYDYGNYGGRTSRGFSTGRVRHLGGTRNYGGSMIGSAHYNRRPTSARSIRHSSQFHYDY